MFEVKIYILHQGHEDRPEWMVLNDFLLQWIPDTDAMTIKDWKVLNNWYLHIDSMYYSICWKG